MAAIPQAAIPQAAIDDPRYKLGYLVVTHCPGVDPTGASDSLAGLQQAVDDAYANGLVALFPSGTYVISDTLRCRDWHLRDSSNSLNHGNPSASKAHILQGSSIGPRPVIKLALNPAKDFANPQNPRPLLLYRLYQSKGYPNAAQADPPDSAPLDAPAGYAVNSDWLYNWELRNLELDCGGKAGAIGVSFPAAQGALIYRVKVDATGAYAGLFQIPGANWGVVDVEVVGGRYGIVASPPVGGSGSSIFGARLLNQENAALVYWDFVPLTMAGFQIEKNTPPVITVNNTIRTNDYTMVNSSYAQIRTAWSTMTLLDGSIRITGTAGSTAAISNPQGKNLYLRNVHVGAASNLVKSASLPALTGSGAWSRIDEYSYTDQRSSAPATDTFRTWSMIDGATNTTAERVKQATPDSGPPPDDPVLRHLPVHGMPVYEGGGSPPAIVVTDPPYSAIPGDTLDDTAAIQRAIDDAAAAGHGRVMIPKFGTGGTSSGAFLLTNTITLHANTVLFGAAKAFSSELRTHPTWQPAVATDIVRTVDDASASTYLGNLAIASAVTLLRYPFSLFHWRAGRASETFNLNADMPYYWWPDNPPQYPAYTALRFSGNAGGRHFFSPGAHMDTRDNYPFGTDNRAVRIEGTHEPLWLYGWNLETANAQTPEDQRRYNVEIVSARNIRWLGWKQEGPNSMLRISDTENFALYSAGSMRYVPPPDRGFVEVTGASANLLMANLLVQADEGTNAPLPLLREALTSQPTNAIIYPEGVSLYKRGMIDDNDMRLLPPKPRLTLGRSGGADVLISLDSGETGYPYHIESSTDLVNWSTLQSVVPGAAGTGALLHLNALTLPRCFYRATP